MWWSRKSVDQVYEAALEALDVCDFKRAARLGRKLKAAQFSAAFEVLARVYRETEQPDRAIAELEEGVRCCPAVASLWHQLATSYSDAGRFADAHRAYAEARRHSDPPDHRIDLNEALAFLREEQPADGLRLVEAVPADTRDPAPGVVAESRARLLNALQRHEEALRIAEGGLAQTQAAPLYVERARALWFGRHDHAAALDDLWRAIALEQGNENARWLIREIENRRSPAAQLWRLLLRGRWHEVVGEGSAIPEFYASYHVVADSAAEALELAARFEPPAVRDSLVIDESEALEPRPDDPKGVYQCGGHTFFVED